MGCRADGCQDLDNLVFTTARAELYCLGQQCTNSTKRNSKPSRPNKSTPPRKICLKLAVLLVEVLSPKKMKGWGFYSQNRRKTAFTKPNLEMETSRSSSFCSSVSTF